MAPINPVTLEVFSDLACPWCFIGKRRLERALAERPKDAPAIDVQWRAYELNPGLPPEGVEAGPYFLQKFGSAERVQAAYARVRDAGLPDGIRFDFGAMKRAPNTRLSHRLVKLAREKGQDGLAKDALFRAHFEEGLDISDPRVALARLRQAGVDVEGFDDRLAAGEALDEVVADETLARTLGVDGVPLFLAQRRYAVSGAQAPEVLRRLFEVGTQPK